MEFRVAVAACAKHKKFSARFEKMRKTNPVRFSSAVGEAWMHCMFKVKFCHDIFDDELHREAMRTLLLEAAFEHDIPVGEIGFDANHVHFMADIGNYDRPEVAKLLRGPSAKRFFEYFPELKKSLFWDSGLWNPAYYIGSPRNIEDTIRYIQRQKYGIRSPLHDRRQTSLTAFAA